MKRKVLCVFSLVLFLLIFCTLLSPSIEREMRTQIQVKKVHEAMKMHNHTIPKMAVTWPDGAKLYQVVEGKGWNTGSRIEEVSPYSYSLARETVFLLDEQGRLIGTEEGDVIHAELFPGKNYDIVLAASRQPAVGDAVSVVENFEEREDVYIIYYPEGAVNLDAYPNTFKPVAQSDTALIVTPTKAYAPYFEQQTLNSLGGMEAEHIRAYSLADARQFYKMMPLVALLATLMVLGILLWGYSCVLSAKRERPGLLWRNAAFCGVILIAVPFIAGAVDLPASLLPKDNILQFSHYRREFSQIFAALESAGSDLLRQERSEALWICGGMILAAVLMMTVLVVVDRRRK